MKFKLKPIMFCLAAGLSVNAQAQISDAVSQLIIEKDEIHQRLLLQREKERFEYVVGSVKQLKSNQFPKNTEKWAEVDGLIDEYISKIQAALPGEDVLDTLFSSKLRDALDKVKRSFDDDDDDTGKSSIEEFIETLAENEDKAEQYIEGYILEQELEIASQFAKDIGLVNLANGYQKRNQETLFGSSSNLVTAIQGIKSQANHTALSQTQMGALKVVFGNVEVLQKRVNALLYPIAKNAFDIEINKQAIAKNKADIAKNSQRLDNIAKRMSNLDTKVKRNLASQTALTGLSQPYNPGKVSVTAAVGSSAASVAVAAGAGYRFDQRYAAKVGVALNAGSTFSYNAAVNFEF